MLFSKTFDEHLEHLRITLECMHGAGLTMKPGKVQLASSRVKLLGYVVDHSTVQPSEDKLKELGCYSSEVKIPLTSMWI